jgi:hypothetical protein
MERKTLWTLARQFLIGEGTIIALYKPRLKRIVRFFNDFSLIKKMNVSIEGDQKMSIGCN